MTDSSPLTVSPSPPPPGSSTVRKHSLPGDSDPESASLPHTPLRKKTKQKAVSYDDSDDAYERKEAEEIITSAHTDGDASSDDNDTPTRPHHRRRDTATNAANDPRENFSYLRRLKPVRMYGSLGNGEVKIIPVADFRLLVKSSDTVRRIERAATMDSQAGITNLATADPDDLAMTGNLYPTTKGKTTHHPFFLVGKCQFSSVTRGERGRQVCVAPLDLTWPRLAANIGSAFSRRKLFASTYRDGISFSTFMQSRTTSSTSTPQSSPQRGLKNYDSAKPTRFYAFPAGLPPDANIPVYDGRRTFRLRGFDRLPAFAGEIPVGSAVFVIFTAQRYDKMPPGGIKDLVSNVAFKALAVMVLHDPVFDEDIEDFADHTERPLGVETDVDSNESDSEVESF